MSVGGHHGSRGYGRRLRIAVAAGAVSFLWALGVSVVVALI